MKTLKELSEQELVELFKKNQALQDYCYQLAYDEAMLCQEEDSRLIGCDVFDVNSHYSSFYFSTPEKYGVKAPEQVAGKLDKNYMNDDNAKLYDELCKAIETWEGMTIDEQDTAEGEALFDQACDICDELADGLTKQLRIYEDIDEGYALETLKQNASGLNFMADWETDGQVVYEHITKTYR